MKLLCLILTVIGVHYVIAQGIDQGQVQLAISDIRDAQRIQKAVIAILETAGGANDVADAVKIINNALTSLIRQEVPLDRALTRLGAAYNQTQPQVELEKCVDAFCSEYGQDYFVVVQNIHGLTYQKVYSIQNEYNCKKWCHEPPEEVKIKNNVKVTDSLLVYQFGKRQLVFSKREGSNGLLKRNFDLSVNETIAVVSFEDDQPIAYDLLKKQLDSSVELHPDQQVDLSSSPLLSLA